ncbi:MAG: HipA domain-containing protein, partial [Lysobacter sp.]
IAFLMDSTGRWRLSPAYDLIYANGHGWTSQHQMTVAGVSHEPTDDDMLRVASEHGIRNGSEIIEQVREAVTRWPDFADASGVSSEWIETIQDELRAGQTHMASQP